MLSCAAVSEHSPSREYNDYGCANATSPYHDTRLYEVGFEDENEDDHGECSHDGRTREIFIGYYTVGKALPHTPTSQGPYDGPPSPPPKPRLAVAIPVIVHPPGSENGCMHGSLGVGCTRVASESEKPARSPKRGGNYPHNGSQHLATPTRSLPRSPATRRPREFFARSGVKRTASKSKSKSKSMSRMAPFGQRDESGDHTQIIQILVSTQTTATQSAPDAGRPRVYYPRSSSLPGAQRIITTITTVPAQSSPTPPAKSAIKHRASRALPAVPENRVASVVVNTAVRRSVSIQGSPVASSRRIRPLPVPGCPPPYPF
ncbi:hypothetical protein C8F04DRAFT_1100719 [Mycena alexandri]|uniref:Uncharacterized protein n=1 Tax=Mycena alexandri TaxID=1745969 RepID=A0AAD6SVT4_9AGAR|nr:hypothetical protein C8F04DRAFT_1100719 [Mycena alexandri]